MFVSGKEASIVLTDPVHPQHTTVETLVSFHFLVKFVFPQTSGLLAVVGEAASDTFSKGERGGNCTLRHWRPVD